MHDIIHSVRDVRKERNTVITADGGVPALVCPDVVTTVGLGDTLTAGIFNHGLKMVGKADCNDLF